MATNTQTHHRPLSQGNAALLNVACDRLRLNSCDAQFLPACGVDAHGSSRGFADSACVSESEATRQHKACERLFSTHTPKSTIKDLRAQQKHVGKLI